MPPVSSASWRRTTLSASESSATSCGRQPREAQSPAVPQGKCLAQLEQVTQRASAVLGGRRQPTGVHFHDGGRPARSEVVGQQPGEARYRPASIGDLNEQLARQWVGRTVLDRGTRPPGGGDDARRLERALG